METTLLPIWKHGLRFEPTMIFAFAIHFAEAVGATIYALPDTQFCIHKTDGGFAFVDLAGEHGKNGVRDLLAPDKLLRALIGERFPRAAKIAQEILSRMLLR